MLISPAIWLSLSLPLWSPLGLPLSSASGTALAESELEQSLAILEGLSEQKLGLVARDDQLEAVLEDLQARMTAPLRVEWEALAGLQIKPSTKVTLRVPDGSVRDVLAAIMLAIAPQYETPVFDVGAGHVIITTVEGAARLRQTHMYDLRGVLGDDRAEEALRNSLERRDQRNPDAAPPSTAPPGNPAPTGPDARPEGEPDDAAATPPEPVTRGGRLMSMLIEHIDPEAWLAAGGSRGRIDERDGFLYVTAAPRIHFQLRALLDQLQTLHPRSASIEATLVRLPAEQLELLRRRHESASLLLGENILASAGLERLWSGSALTRFGELYEITTVGVGAAKGAAAEGTELTLIAKPTLEADGSAIAMRVEFRQFDGTIRNVATTTASTPVRGATLLLDLGEDAAGKATVLVVRVKGA